MTGAIVPIAALAYEDIRQEANGAISLMGVIHSGELALLNFPYRQRLGVALIVNIAELGELTILAKLRYNGTLKWSNELEIEFLEKGDGVIVPLGVTTASFDAPGTLELAYEVHGQERTIQQWIVSAEAGQTLALDSKAAP